MSLTYENDLIWGRKTSLDETVSSALGESLFLKCASGEQFVVSLADDFATEAELKGEAPTSATPPQVS